MVLPACASDACYDGSFFFFFILRRMMGKNKALAHHTSTYFHTRHGSGSSFCMERFLNDGAP